METIGPAEAIGILFGAGGVGAVFIKGAFKYLTEHRLSKARKKHILGLRKIASIYDHLNQLMASDPRVNRVMVIRSSNGGEIPKPGCRIFIRILHEAYRTLEDSIVHTNLWDERQADQHYLELVRKIATTPKVHLTTSELPEDSALRTLYEGSGTLGSRVYLLTLSGTEMIYLSINYTDIAATPPKAKAIRSSVVSGLQQLFK